jgi:elongation factor G
VGGVQPQSETVWRQANKYRVPRIAYINKMDRTGAAFHRVLHAMRERLGCRAVAVQIPVGEESGFQGVVDLVTMKALLHPDDLGVDVTQAPVPEALADRAARFREAMVEAAAEFDEALMQKYINGEEMTPDEIRRGLRRGTLAYGMVPVVCGASLRNKGVQPLLDAIVDFLPSPLDVLAVQGTDPTTGQPVTRSADDDQPLSALAFKIMLDPYVGRLTYFRIYSGTLRKGGTVFNASKRQSERISRILRMHANRREDLPEVGAGDIVAGVGLKQTTTGDTLCDAQHPLLLESIHFPEPVISVAIEPKTKADQDRLSQALASLTSEDPTFTLRVDEDTGQTIISGMGELHLEIVTDRLLRQFNVGANVGKPQVAYRETVTRSAQGEGRYIRQTGGRGQYGHVVLQVEPSDTPGSTFSSAVRGGAVPSQFIPAVEAGVSEALESGVLAGYPVNDVRVTLLDGSAHEVDSSDLAFKIAASMAFRDAAHKAAPVLLEPIMRVEVVTPETALGDVIGDLNARRADIQGMEPTPGATQTIRCLVPLAEMFGYATTLRSLTQGRATYTMEPYRYATMPSPLADEILGRVRAH